MWMAVLWNNFIIPKSFHIRHVSAVFQEFYVAKDEFCPKKQGRTQPRTALLKNFGICFLQPHCFYDLQKQAGACKPVFIVAVVVQWQPLQ